MSNFLQRALGWLAVRSGSFTQAFFTGTDLDAPRRGISEPLRRSAWVRAAVMKVAQPIASVELYLSENDEELDDPALDEFWSAPGLNADGSRMSQADFIELLAVWLQLKGEYFLILDETWRVPFPEVAMRTPLIVARPDRMRHVVRGAVLESWEWTDAAGRRVLLDPSRVIHVKLANPYDDWRGMGPLEAAEIAAGADYASAQFAKNISEANGDQGMIVVAKGGMPTPEQQQQIKDALREKTAAQRRGIFRPVFLGGDVTIEDPKVRSMDASFVAQRLENRKEIAAAFGVPPSFFDPQASYSIGSASDRFILIEETARPLSHKINGGLTRVVRLQTGRNVCVESDWDDHSVMQAVRRERIDTGLKLWATGMPMERVSDYLNLDLPEFPGWEVGYLPFSVAPAGEAMPPENNPALGEPIAPPETTDPVQEMRRAFEQRRAPDEEQPCACGCSLEDGVQHLTRAEADVWRKGASARLAAMKMYRSRFDRVLLLARAQVLRKLESAEAKSITQRATAADFLFNLPAFKNDFMALMRGAAQQTLLDAGKQVFEELKREDPYTMASKDVLQFVQHRENRLAGVPDDVFERIKGTIQDGFDAGDSMKQIANRVRAEFNDISTERGRVIAQTETSAAFGFGRDAAMKRAGVQWKKWLTSNNANVRAGHRAAHGQIVPITDPFVVVSLKYGPEALMYPGDINGSPDNTINCHCVSIAVAEGPQGEAEPSL